jgi:hypothetical protein
MEPCLRPAVHGKQVLTYLRLSKRPLGVLLNFGGATFREGIRRIVNNHTDVECSRLRVNQSAVITVTDVTGEGWKRKSRRESGGLRGSGRSPQMRTVPTTST